MQWSEAIKPPSEKLLRQFAGLFLLVFLALAGWRVWQGQVDVWAKSLAVLAVVVGGLGLVWPRAIRYVYTGWMIVAFPIGWTISMAVLGLLFFVLFTPIAALFKLIGRDELRLRRRDERVSHWTAKPAPSSVREYFRQF
jgi:hypothetical protein